MTLLVVVVVFLSNAPVLARRLTGDFVVAVTFFALTVIVETPFFSAVAAPLAALRLALDRLLLTPGKGAIFRFLVLPPAWSSSPISSFSLRLPALTAPLTVALRSGLGGFTSRGFGPSTPRQLSDPQRHVWTFLAEKGSKL